MADIYLGIGILAVLLGLGIGLVVLSESESLGAIFFSMLLIGVGVFLVALGIREPPWAD